MERRDADTVERVARGDEMALRGVFDELGPSVKAIALRVVRDHTLADDVVQDTFLSLWQHPDRYDPARGTLGTFLRTIAHRRAVDLVRSEVARSRREQHPPDPAHPDVEGEVWSRHLSRAVREALGDLTEGERDAISLAFFEGLSYVQVAERLGAPEGTVKSRIRKGMKKLSRTLAGMEA